MIRYILAMPIAFVVTIALFLTMRYLILVEYKPEKEIVSTSIDLTRQKRDETIQQKERSKPDRPKEQKTPPPPPPSQLPQANPNKQASLTTDLSSFRKDFDLGKVSQAVDMNAIPIFCQPNVPADLVGNGAWVQMQFDITAEGNVVDPVVISSSKPGSLERLMLREVKRCKFKAGTKDGKPVAAYNKRYLFTLKPPDD